MATTELRRPLFGSSAPAGFPSDRASDAMVSTRERERLWIVLHRQEHGALYPTLELEKPTFRGVQLKML